MPHPKKLSSVYVDRPEWPHGNTLMCHMLADRVADLHDMADRIGVARWRFQSGSFPFYYVPLSRRKLAINFGALEITPDQFIALARSQSRRH